MVFVEDAERRICPALLSETGTVIKCFDICYVRLSKWLRNLVLNLGSHR